MSLKEDLPEGCVLCSPFSVQQPKARMSAVSSSSSISRSDLIRCNHCGKFQCLKCCEDLYAIVSKLCESSRLHPEDKACITKSNWFNDIVPFLGDRSTIASSINYGTCCQLTSITNTSNKSSVMFDSMINSLPHDLYCSNKSPDINLDGEEDSEYLPAYVCSKLASKKVKTIHTQDSGVLDFLLDYHDPLSSFSFRKRTMPPSPSKMLRRRRKKCGGSCEQHLRYHGALVLSQFGIVLLAQADNNNLRTDILGLGKSTSCPPVFHYVIGLEEAKSIHTMLGCRRLNPIPRNCWHTPVDIATKSPENPLKTRVWTVQLVFVHQMMDTCQAGQDRGTKPLSFFTYFYELGQHDLSSKVDVTLIVGNFSPSESREPKLLCMKFGRMMKGIITDNDAHSLFACLMKISGKSGFELRRRDGSAGIINSQSHGDLLSVLSHLHSAIPRKVWGTFILPLRHVYLIYYKRASPKHDNKSSWTHVWYSPPHNGGRFKLPKHLLQMYPCVAEFSYQKMLAVMLMEAINKARCKVNLPPISPQETINESNNMRKAREKISARQESSMIDFIHAYNSLNDFNVITHAVGNHEDHFPGGPSFENKMNVIHKLIDQSGRGGATFAHQYTWCLVDWKSKDP